MLHCSSTLVVFNGSFSGTPTTSGIFNFRVTVTGFGSCSGFQDYVLSVNCPTIAVNPASLPAARKVYGHLPLLLLQACG